MTDPTGRGGPPGRLGQAALAAAEAGWYVFPVAPGGKVPAIGRWESAATRDPERICRWWRGRPWNVGLCAGRSGLLVVDVDAAHDASAPQEWAGARDGGEVLERLTAAAGVDTPYDTYTVATPTGGRHLYFRMPDGVALRNTQARLGWRIDTRGHGGYVLAAGSRARSGHYRTVHALPVAPLPSWLLAALTPPPPIPKPRHVVSAGRSHAYLRAVIDNECDAVRAAAVGERHRTLLRAARRLGHWVGGGALTDPDARAALTAAAGGFVGVDGYTARQVQRDIVDGLAYGARRPSYLGGRLASSVGSAPGRRTEGGGPAEQRRAPGPA